MILVILLGVMFTALICLPFFAFSDIDWKWWRGPRYEIDYLWVGDVIYEKVVVYPIPGKDFQESLNVWAKVRGLEGEVSVSSNAWIHPKGF
jgi:hypothetical protein